MRYVVKQSAHFLFLYVSEMSALSAIGNLTQTQVKEVGFICRRFFLTMSFACLVRGVIKSKCEANQQGGYYIELD